MVLLLNEPILPIVLVLLLEIDLRRVALGLGFLAGQELIDFAAILRLLLSAWGSARVGHLCVSLLGCTRSWSVLERLICRTWCRIIFSKPENVLEAGAPLLCPPCADSGWERSFASDRMVAEDLGGGRARLLF